MLERKEHRAGNMELEVILVLCETRSQSRGGSSPEVLQENSGKGLKLLMMQRRFCQVAVVLLLATYLCGPAFESVDHWDHFPQSGNDIILNILGIAACLGAVAALSRLLGGLIRRARKESDLHPATFFLEEFSPSAYSNPFLESSPPALRI